MSIINILAPFENIFISINKVTCENIDIDFCINEKILKNINTDKEILKKIHIDKGILEKNYLDVDRDIGPLVHWYMGRLVHGSIGPLVH